jgi:hypothetical protein
MSVASKHDGTVSLNLASTPWRAVRHAAFAAIDRKAEGAGLGWRDWQLLERITRLCWVRARGPRRPAAYAWCSESWLAHQVGWRRETVSRHLHRLRRSGLLQITNRRPMNGSWQTNLYHLGGAVLAALIRLVRRPAAPPSTRAVGAASSFACSTASVSAGSHATMAELLERWMLRGTRTT